VNSLAKKFYSVGGDLGLQDVIILSERKDLVWEELSEKAPDLPRGWFELSRIHPEERIEFVSSLWCDKLPFQPKVHPFLSQFFARLDDIAIVLVREGLDLQPEMVYSLADNSSFFRGFPPAGEEDIRIFRKELRATVPSDYLSFLRLHNGFGKLSEQGLIPMEEIRFVRERMKKASLAQDKMIHNKGLVIDPEALIPFYEDYGLNSFQCFFADWYPGSEMGNVYLSGINYTVSDITNRSGWTEQLAFPTFLEWLVYYLEGMSISN
jgi:hypothetical protein